MKKLNFLTAIFAMSCVIANAQTPTFPNGGFENNWVQNTCGKGSYWDFSEENFLTTLNSLYELEGEHGDAPLTSFREEDAYEGNYALKMVSNTMTFGGETIFLPGACGTLEIDFMNVDCKMGRTFNARPTNVSGYMKYAPVNGDSAAVEVTLFKNKKMIGKGKKVFYSEVSAYSQFIIDINYTTEEIPDSIIFIAAASANYDFTSIETLMKCKGQNGSALYLDELYFNAPTGIKESLISLVNMNIYPNPSAEQINIQLEKFVNGNIAIYDQLGRKVFEQNIDSQSINVNVSDFASGMYIVNLTAKDKVIATKKFIKE